MRINYIPILIILFFSACSHQEKKENIEKKNFFYPRKEKFKTTKNLRNILLDSIDNYSELLKKMDQIACNDSVPTISFSTKEENYKIISWYVCSNDVAGFHTLRSRIFLQNDSIYTNDKIKHPIDSLNLILKKHLFNKGRNFYYSDSPEKAGIEIYHNSNTDPKVIKNQLINLSREFDKLDNISPDTLYLYIYFRDMPFRTTPIKLAPKHN